jgi:hypothetical protein
MSLPTIQQAPQLPAHLANFADLGFSLNENITGGMKLGGHPSIGIKQAKWRIREGGGEEIVQSFTLNVIIVNANKHLSKVFYAGAYTGEEGKAPDCFSDNGVGPSAQASKPQCATCAMCPNNVWGSKVTPAGNKIKACSDYKKLAVILADDPDRDVYELRVPGASLSQLNEIMSKLIKSQVPIPAVIFELSFDATADYPKIVFKPLGYVSAEQADSIKGWVNSDESKEAVGENDVAAGSSQIAQRVSSAAIAAPVQQDSMAFLNSPPPAATPATPATPETPKGRGRPRKAAEATAQREPVQMSLDIPGMQAPAQATPINPAKTDADLDALLAGIL